VTGASLSMPERQNKLKNNPSALKSLWLARDVSLQF